MGWALEQYSLTTIEEVKARFEQFDFSSAIGKTWALVAEADHYLSVCKPWADSEDETQRPQLEETLYRAAEVLWIVLTLAHPVIPEGTQRIWQYLGQVGKLADARFDNLKWGGLKPGTQVGKPEAVFPRIEKKEASERIEIMENEIRNPGSTQPAPTQPTKAGGATAAPASAPAPAPGAKITIDDFAKVELRAGVVKSAERIQGADKLLKVMVDIGDEMRQVLAGIATAYTPEELVGRKVVVVTNLAPRKMRGLESNGMLLAGSSGLDGKPVLCTFAEEIAPGSKVK